MTTALLSLFADSCKGGGFLGFPTWYEYLPGTTDPNNGLCTPQLNDLSNIWLVVAAVIEIMLRVAAIVAVAFIIYGSITYITSQGEPDSTKRAKDTIVNALVGLAIAVLAAAIIQFIAGSIT
jgi:hypothetical protein